MGDKLLQLLAVRDHALAAGLATQPVGWSTNAQLTRFPPASVTDPDGSQIFYRGLRRGWAAEAYVRTPADGYSRLRIACGYIGRARGRGTRGYKVVRLASLHRGSSYRLSVILASASPTTITIGLARPNARPVTIRLLVTTSTFGVLSRAEEVVSHDDGWPTLLAQKDRAQHVSPSFTSAQALENTVHEGFGPFIPLLKKLAWRINGQLVPHVPALGPAGVGGTNGSYVPTIESFEGVVDTVCDIAVDQLGEAVKEGVKDWKVKVVIAVGSAALKWLCKHLVEEGEEGEGES